jgi:hypothetical protein
MTDLSICIELNASGFIILCVVSCNEPLALETAIVTQHSLYQSCTVFVRRNN